MAMRAATTHSAGTTRCSRSQVLECAITTILEVEVTFG